MPNLENRVIIWSRGEIGRWSLFAMILLTMLNHLVLFVIREAITSIVVQKKVRDNTECLAVLRGRLWNRKQYCFLLWKTETKKKPDPRNSQINCWKYSTCGALRDLVPFIQFKKREKYSWRSVYFSKVAGFNLQLY